MPSIAEFLISHKKRQKGSRTKHEEKLTLLNFIGFVLKIFLVYVRHKINKKRKLSKPKATKSLPISLTAAVAYPGILFGGGSTNSVEHRGQREQRSGGGSPLVRCSGGSCILVQKISFHIVKFS